MENLKIEKDPMRKRLIATKLSPEEFSRVKKFCVQQDISLSRLIRYSIEEVLKRKN